MSFQIVTGMRSMVYPLTPHLNHSLPLNRFDEIAHGLKASFGSPIQPVIALPFYQPLISYLG